MKMKSNRPSKIIRTDKWFLDPSDEQRVLFARTVEEYRKLCRFLVTVVNTHWVELGSLSGKDVIPAVERLMHPTAKNPVVQYPVFSRVFYKFPSYYRRAAIAFAVGQVSSFHTRYREWISGNSRTRKDAKPPTLNPDVGCYPTLYKGQCYKLHGFDRVEIKVFTGTDWVWTRVGISGLGYRHQVVANRMASPSLILKQMSSHLSVPFECKPDKRTGSGCVVGVDLGINTTATVSVVSKDGTVMHREFIHPGRDIDRRDKRLKSISRKASKTMGKGGKLHKGFARAMYQKCQNINTQIGHIVSKRIVRIAEQFNADAIVFEHLKGWKPRGGRKRSNLRQRFHGWLKSRIAQWTEEKWAERGGKTIYIFARGTSSNAYDGSGSVKRSAQNYALSVFPSGKQYNCDLNGSYNIAARGIIKLIGRNDHEDVGGKSTPSSPRNRAVLCDLWRSDTLKLASRTPPSSR